MKSSHRVESPDYTFERFMYKVLNNLSVEEYTRLRWEMIFESREKDQKGRKTLQS